MTHEDKKLISISEFIEKAKGLGIRLGRGNPHHRIRYYIKIGLLPHQVRAKESTGPENSSAVGHLPTYSLYLLEKIEALKEQKKNKEEIKHIIAKERLSFEAQEEGFSVEPKRFIQNFNSILLPTSTLLLFILVLLNFSQRGLGEQSIHDTSENSAVVQTTFLDKKTLPAVNEVSTTSQDLPSQTKTIFVADVANSFSTNQYSNPSSIIVINQGTQLQEQTFKKKLRSRLTIFFWMNRAILHQLYLCKLRKIPK